jgi:hypothetical protein
LPTVRIEPSFDELIRQSAQGDVLHNDDTSMPVLSLRREIDAEADEAERTGIFTSGIVSIGEGRKIALFFTGRQHAGENLRDVLTERATATKPPIQMCDALHTEPAQDAPYAGGVGGEFQIMPVFAQFPTNPIRASQNMNPDQLEGTGFATL